MSDILGYLPVLTGDIRSGDAFRRDIRSRDAFRPIASKQKHLILRKTEQNKHQTKKARTTASEPRTILEVIGLRLFASQASY